MKDFILNSEIRKAVKEAMEFLQEEGFKFPTEDITKGYISPFEALLEVLDESLPNWNKEYTKEQIKEIMEILNRFWNYEGFIDAYTSTEQNIEAIEEDNDIIRIGFLTFNLECDKKTKKCKEIED